MVWNKDENIRDAACWLSRKVNLIELKNNNIVKGTRIIIYRGGIFNVELGEGNIGGEKNKLRPCLVISHNNLNKGDTAVVLPLTTKFKCNIVNGKKIPCYGNHFILYKDKYSFLSEDSCIKCEDIRAVDLIRIRDHLGNINPDDLDKLKNRLEFAFGYKRIKRKS